MHDREQAKWEGFKTIMHDQKEVIWQNLPPCHPSSPSSSSSASSLLMSLSSSFSSANDRSSLKSFGEHPWYARSRCAFHCQVFRLLMVTWTKRWCSHLSCSQSCSPPSYRRWFTAAVMVNLPWSERVEKWWKEGERCHEKNPHWSFPSIYRGIAYVWELRSCGMVEEDMKSVLIFWGGSDQSLCKNRW